MIVGFFQFIYENRVPTNLSRDECHTFFNCHRYEDFTVKSIDEEFRYRARFEKDFSFSKWKFSIYYKMLPNSVSLKCHKRQIVEIYDNSNKQIIPRILTLIINKEVLILFKNNTVMSWKKTQEEVSKVLIAHLKPILEKWIGGEIPLTLSNYYGVR